MHSSSAYQRTFTGSQAGTARAAAARTKRVQSVLEPAAGRQCTLTFATRGLAWPARQHRPPCGRACVHKQCRVRAQPPLGPPRRCYAGRPRRRTAAPEHRPLLFQDNPDRDRDASSRKSTTSARAASIQRCQMLSIVDQQRSRRSTSRWIRCVALSTRNIVIAAARRAAWLARTHARDAYAATLTRSPLSNSIPVQTDQSDGRSRRKPSRVARASPAEWITAGRLQLMQNSHDCRFLIRWPNRIHPANHAHLLRRPSVDLGLIVADLLGPGALDECDDRTDLLVREPPFERRHVACVMWARKALYTVLGDLE